MNVHVIDSPADTLMFDTRLPSLQIADAWDQPLGTVSDSEYPEPAGTSLNVWVFESVPSASSSSEKLLGVSPPPAVKAKSCASSGCASLTTTICPRLWFVKVQVTVSSGPTLMLPIGLPSLQVALA